MGKRIIKTEERWDDLDSGVVEDVRTVRFSLNDENYSIDLGETNRVRLTSALERFIANASPAGAPTSSTSSPRRRRGPAEVAQAKRAAAERKEELEELRKWARSNGYTVSNTGRIAQHIAAAFAAAQR